MLRITTHDESELLTFQLEGSLAGPWVKELRHCWQSTRAGRDTTAVRVDLSAVTFIDAAGKELLAAMHSQGAEFVCAGCLMRAVVAEITRAPVCECGESGEEMETK
jgi:anti-anti-sigma regulatory factor